MEWNGLALSLVYGNLGLLKGGGGFLSSLISYATLRYAG